MGSETPLSQGPHLDLSAHHDSVFDPRLYLLKHRSMGLRHFRDRWGALLGELARCLDAPD